MKILNRKILAALLFLLGVGGFAAHSLMERPVLLPQSPLRLHILANSDSVYDQQLKLALRDEVIGLVGDSMADATDKNEATMMLAAALPELTAACNEFLAQRTTYAAHVELTKSNFPQISYDNFTLPAGEYDALRIVLGEGKGHNWWCVLFPPLCFVDLAGERQAVAAVSSGAPAEDTLEVRFKFWDWLN